MKSNVSSRSEGAGWSLMQALACTVIVAIESQFDVKDEQVRWCSLSEFQPSDMLIKMRTATDTYDVLVLANMVATQSRYVCMYVIVPYEVHTRIPSRNGL